MQKGHNNVVPLFTVEDVKNASNVREVPQNTVLQSTAKPIQQNKQYTFTADDVKNVTEQSGNGTINKTWVGTGVSRSYLPDITQILDNIISANTIDLPSNAFDNSTNINIFNNTSLPESKTLNTDLSQAKSEMEEKINQNKVVAANAKSSNQIINYNNSLANTITPMYYENYTQEQKDKSAPSAQPIVSNNFAANNLIVGNVPTIKSDYELALDKGANSEEYASLLDNKKINRNMTAVERETYKYLLGAGKTDDARKYLASVEWQIDHRGENTQLQLQNRLDNEDISNKKRAQLQEKLNDTNEELNYFTDAKSILTEMETDAKKDTGFRGLAMQGRQDTNFYLLTENRNLTEEQKDMVGYYIAIGDLETEQKYAERAELLNEKIEYDTEREARYNEAYDKGKNHKALGTAQNLVEGEFSNVGSFFQTFDRGLTNLLNDSNVPVNLNSNINLMADEAEDIAEGLKGDGNAFTDFLWDTGLSMGQSAINALFGNKIGLTLMALNAAGDKSRDAIKNGATTNEAIKQGLVAGTIEAATEKLPFDNLFKVAKNGGGHVVKNIAEQALLEGTSEMINEVAANFADQLLAKDESDYWKYVEYLVSMGYDRTTAIEMATKQYYAINPLIAGAGGALSGGIMGGGSTAVNRIGNNMVQNNNLQNKTTENNLQALNTENVNSEQQNNIESEQKTNQAETVKTTKNIDLKNIKNGPLHSLIASAKNKMHVTNITYDMFAPGETSARQAFTEYSGITLPETKKGTNEVLRKFVKNGGELQITNNSETKINNLTQTGIENITQKTENITQNTKQNTNIDENGRYIEPTQKSKVQYAQKSAINEFLDNTTNMNEFPPALRKELNADMWNIAEKMHKQENCKAEIKALYNKLYHGGTGYNVKYDDEIKIARNFETAVKKLANNAKQIIKYEAEQKAKKEIVPTVKTMKELAKMANEANEQQKIVTKVVKETVINKRESEIIKEVLKGHLKITDYKNMENYDNMLKVYKEKAVLKKIEEPLKEYNFQRRQNDFNAALDITADYLTYKDKKNGLAYDIHTMERNIFDVVPNEQKAKKIIDTYFAPVHEAVARKTRFKEKIKAEVRKLDLNVYESKYLQLYGEQQTLQKQNNVRNEKELSIIADEMKTLEKKHGSKIDKVKIEKSLKVFRAIYNKLFEKMNEVYIAYGYKPMDYREGYFPHFVEEETFKDKMLAKIGFSQKNNLSADIAGLTSTFKPGRRFNKFALERNGYKTVYDAKKGLDLYLDTALDVIYLTKEIQKLRALERAIRYRYSDEGMQEAVNNILEDNEIDETERQDKINQLYEGKKIGSLSNLVQEVQEYTNLLANKKSISDRSMEHALGRPVYEIVNKMRKKVAANMVGGNITSALTNFIPIAQAMSQVSHKNMAIAMKETVLGTLQENNFEKNSVFLTNRLMETENLSSTTGEKVANKLMKPMQLIDEFVAKTITYAKYIENVEQGMTNLEAMQDADSFATGVMADRSKGALPIQFEKKNIIASTFNMFQVEVANQYGYLFKDLPRHLKNKGLKKITEALMKYLLYSYLYNEIYEKMFNRRSAFDPLGILNETVGEATGYKLPNVLDLAFDFTTPFADKFKTEKLKPYEVLFNAGQNIAQEVPFIGSMLGGGRVPLFSSLPDFGELPSSVMSLFDGSKPRKKVTENLKDIGLDTLTTLVMPAGGSQVKKLINGTQAAIQGASYYTDNNGNDVMRFAIDQTPANIMRSIFGGPYATNEGAAYASGGFKNALSAAQTKKAQVLRDEYDICYGDYIEFRQSISGDSKKSFLAALEENETFNDTEKYNILKTEYPKLAENENPYSDEYIDIAEFKDESAKLRETAYNLKQDYNIDYNCFHVLYEFYNELEGADKKEKLKKVIVSYGFTQEQNNAIIQALGYKQWD